MAQFSLHAYDADVWIPEFRGMNQADDSLNGDLRFAAEAVNVETPNGVLQPHAGYETMDGEFEARVETMAHFHRRWYTGVGSKNTLVCASGGQLYTRQEGSIDGWRQITLPGSIGSFNCNVWSWVTYEINQVGLDHPLDVLLMSNAQDGMIMVEPPDRPATWGDAIANNLTWENPDHETWEDDHAAKWNVTAVSTGDYKFGVIERYAERIWGAAVDGEPDLLVYSAPYDPTDWAPADTELGELPEDHAGEISVPSWDGDSFSTLKAFGDQLLAFKEHRVWRILGTDPGEYTVKEQYGGGAPFPNTVVVDVEQVIMAEEDGLAVYDGMSVKPFARDQVEKIWRKVNRSAQDQMCAALFKNRYYIAIPVDGSTVNNALIVFNQEDNSVLYYDDIHIEALLATNDVLYATSSKLPGKVITLPYDSWVSGKATGGKSRWVSPWIDFGRKSVSKGGFEVYFSPEVRKYPVIFRFSIQTEKKTKTKEVAVAPTVAKAKQKRIRFGGTGRRFRLVIETNSNPQAAVWRLLGGIQMVVEIDPD